MKETLACLLITTAPFAAVAQSTPPVHSLGRVAATSPVAFSAVSSLRVLSDGRVLVADLGKRQMLTLDASLANPRVVLDSTQGKENSFATGFGSLDRYGTTADLMGALALTHSFVAPFRGDSSLWYNVAIQSFSVLDPNGNVGRAIAAPSRDNGVWAPLGARSSTVTGIVFTDNVTSRIQPALPPPGGWILDSLVVIRFNYDTRVVDTIAKIGGGPARRVIPATGRGLSTVSSGTPIFPFYDDVVTTSDGTIAIFHAGEYRVEWIGAGDARLPATKLAYPWKRVTDADRTRIVDSINAIRTHRFDSTLAKRAADSARTGAVPTMTSSVGRGGVGTTRQVPVAPPRPPILVDGAEVPDYLPATGKSPIVADADNHVWVRTFQPTPDPGFAVWHVISRTDGVVDRIRVPESATIMGFAPGGFIYLATRDAGAVRLEKVRLR